MRDCRADRCRYGVPKVAYALRAKEHRWISLIRRFRIFARRLSNNKIHETYIFYVHVHVARAKDVKENSKSGYRESFHSLAVLSLRCEPHRRDETSGIQSGFQLEAKSHARAEEKETAVSFKIPRFIFDTRVSVIFPLSSRSAVT